jgi:tetratricopeptide (TPR) repeat protein
VPPDSTIGPESIMPLPLDKPVATRFAPLDTTSRTKQIIAQVDAFRIRKDFHTALSVLRGAIAEMPDARDLREKLYDVLIEAGDRQGAIDEMLIYARYLGGRGDREGAALVLDELLLFEPGQPDATEMLAQLGYEVTYEPQYDEYGNPYPASPEQSWIDPAAYGQASYNWDESSVDPSGYDQRPDSYAQPRGGYSGRRYEPLTSDAPLPSLPMEEESTQFMEAPPSTRGLPLVVPPVPPVPENMGMPPAYIQTKPGAAQVARKQTPQHQPQPARPGAFSQLDEDALEEVDFFARHGMFDQARAMLDDQLSRLPNHPLLLEKKRELDVMAAQALAPTDRESGTRPVPRSADAPAAPAGGFGFDISESLNALDQLEIEPEHEPEPEPAAPPVDVETMFEQFKQGMGAPLQISETDAATHYDLGVAYKEMGLYADAIAEFELASRDPGRECVCLSMIGMIYVQVGEIDAAIDAFIRGLQVRNKTKEQEYALTYEVGNAYEMQGLPEQALMFFQKLAQINPGYQDPRGSVTERIRALDPRTAHMAHAAPADRSRVTDNIDDAFDDMMTGGRKK